jgi:hypothetical protein
MSKEYRCQYQIKTIFYKLNSNSQIEAIWRRRKLKMTKITCRRQDKMKKRRVNILAKRRKRTRIKD